MAEYDGSIRIGTGIDTKEFKAGSKEIESEARRMAKTVSKDLGDSAKIALQKQTDAFVKQNQQYAAQEQKIKDLETRLHELQRTQVETPVFKETSKDLSAAEKRLDNLYGTLRKLEHEGRTDTRPYKDAIVQIDIYKKKVTELQNQLKELKRSGEAYQPADTSKVQKEIAAAEQKQMQMYTALQTATDSLSQKINERVAKEDSVREKIAEEAAEEQRLDQIRVNAVATNDQIIAKVERIKQIEQEIADLKAVGITLGYADYEDRIMELSELKNDVNAYRDSLTEVPEKFSRMKSMAQKAFNAIHSGFFAIGNMGKKVFSGIGTIAKKAFSGIVGAAKKGFSAITSGAKKSSGILSTFSSRLKGLALSLLIFNWISKAFNAMISGMKTGFSNFADYSDSYGQNVQNMKNAMSTLGNQFAAAFAPIAQVVIPWLTSLVNAISTAMTYVAQFIAALGGKNTFTKAKKVQDDYNKSLGGTAKAADKARGALAKFDDLDVLEKKQEDTGGGGGGIDNAGADMFEEAPVENTISSLVQNIKDFIYGEDWAGLGAFIADGINIGLQKIYDVINWDNIGPQITYFIDAFTQTFNSLVDRIDWNLLGETIGAGINTIVNTVYLLITGIDWVKLGNKLAEGLNGLVIEVDAERIGSLIGEKFMILPRMLLGFVSNLDWSAVGTQIGISLNGVVSAIDLSQIGEMLGTALTGFFQMAIDFSSTFDWIAFGTNIYEGINSFFANTDWSTVGKGLSDFVMGIFDAILVAVQGIDWAEIGRSIVDFILGVDWIGLAGKLLEIGVYLIAGLLEGIFAAMAEIGGWIKENVFDPIVNWFKELFGIHSPSTVMAELGTFLMEGLLNGIQSLVDAVTAIWEFMKNIAIGVWESVKSLISGIINAIKTIILTVMNVISTIWNAVWGTIKAVASSVWGGIKSTISTIINGIKTTISTVLSAIKYIWDTVWTGLKTTVTNIFNGIWNTIKKIINSILGGIEGMANGVIRGINSIINALNGLSFTIPATPFSDEMTIGLNLPTIQEVSIPRLATGAVIRGGNPFMAILGDQPAGQTNIEAPLDTIRQAVREELSGMNFGNAGAAQAKVVLNINGVDVGEAMLDDLFSVMARRGYDVSVLGVT